MNKVSSVIVSTILAVSVGGIHAADLTSKSIEINGTSMSYIEQGQGPLLILLHGGLSNHRSYPGKVRDLSKDFRVVAYDQRHYGKVALDKSEKLSLDQQADDLAALIEKLGAGPAHIVGISMGARVAHQAVVKHPNQIKSAYLYEGATNLKVDEKRAAADKKYFGPIIGPVFALLKKGDVHGTAKQLIGAVSGDPTYYDKLPAEKQQNMREAEPGLVRFMTRKRTPPIDCEQMGKGQVPTLMAIGSDSVFFPLMNGKFDKCLGSNGKVVEINGAGHMWPTDDSTAFVKSVREFALKND